MKKIVRSSSLILVLFFGILMFASSNNITGLRSFIVKSGSMEPTIPTGSLVVTTNTHPAYLKQSDVITFIRPTEERDLITHRITRITNDNDYIRILTKGDNNSKADNWEVGGGNVVGKVAFSVPYLGYVFSFAQSKLGILLFILIPAIFILVEEIAYVINLFKNKKSAASYLVEPVEAAVLIVAILFGFSAVSVSSTKALLSDSVQLTNNYFTVTLAPTLTPSPSSCGRDTKINISGNGAGSTTDVSINNNCNTTLTQTNTTTIINNIQTSTSTGNNKSLFNSVSTNTIETGDAESTVSANTQGSSNTVNIFSD